MWVAHKVRYFNDTIHKIRNQVSALANRLLSHERKLMFIRDVLSSMPFHILSVLRPPTAVIHNIERLFTKFLRRDTNSTLRTH